MDNYKKWLEKEQEWINQMTQENKSTMIRTCILCVPACTIILGAIGLMSGGGVMGMLQNALLGAIFGAVAALFALVIMPRPRRSYVTLLERYTKDLSPGEREELGSQMLSSDVKCMDFKGVDKAKQKIMISKSFLVSNTSTGFFMLVKLDQVDQILTEMVDMSVTGRSNGIRVRVNDEAYSIEFYYKKPDGSKPKWFDARCVFPTREIRDQVMQHIQEFVSQRPDPPTILEQK